MEDILYAFAHDIPQKTDRAAAESATIRATNSRSAQKNTG
jgi:hypothetical protein